MTIVISSNLKMCVSPVVLKMLTCFKYCVGPLILLNENSPDEDEVKIQKYSHYFHYKSPKCHQEFLSIFET